MPHITIYSSPLAADLLEQAMNLLQPASHNGNPFASRWVIQPGRLWEQALRRKLADNGMAAGLQFGSLRLTLEQTLKQMAPGLQLAGEEELFWALFNRLDAKNDSLDEIGLTEDTPPRQWLKARGKDASLDRVLLARMLTTILDDHATHRPIAVQKWIENPSAEVPKDAWIARLAHHIWAGETAIRPLALHATTFQETIESGPQNPPAAIVAVLTGAQPMIYLQMLSLLAKWTDVHLLALTTCMGGQADATTTWGEIRAKFRKQPTKLALEEYLAEEKWLLSGSLQSCWGQSGIDLQKQLIDLEEFAGKQKIEIKDTGNEQIEESLKPALACLQSDILVNTAPRSKEDRIKIDAGDASLRLINAPSPLRELEGARDAIRHALQSNQELKPSDILIVLADVQRYGPLLPAVFGPARSSATDQGPDGLPRIPWHLADRSLRADSDTMAALLHLLDVFTGRLTLPALAECLALPAVQARLGLSREDSQELIEGLKEARFRWGLTKQEREATDQPGQEDGRWTLDFALQRLAAGFALPDNAVVGDTDNRLCVTPLPRFEGLAAATWANLMVWAEDFQAARDTFVTGNMNLSDWIAWMHEWVPKLIATGAGQDGQSVWIQRISAVLAEAATQSKDAKQASLSAAAFTALFKETISAFEQTLPIGKGIGGMTVASPRMARAVPARMIVVVGLSDGVWPRQEVMRPRGLLQPPTPGDRQRRHEDKLMALEWVLSARELLVWTWTGRDPHRGKDLPPSTVIGELLDVCNLTFAEADFEETLHLHGFHPDHFSGPEKTRSFDRIAAAAAGTLNVKATPPKLLARPIKEDLWDIPGLLSFAMGGNDHTHWDPETWLRLASKLVQFWGLPCKEYLQTIGVAVEDKYKILPEREDLKLGSLEGWGITNRLISEYLKGTPDQDFLPQWKQQYQKAGKLPPGNAGDTAWTEAIKNATTTITLAREEQNGGDFTLSSLYSMNWEDKDAIRVTASNQQPKHLLRAYIEQCALSALHGKARQSLVVFKNAIQQLPQINAVDDAITKLRQWTALAFLGTSFPLPLFPETSAKWVEKRDENACETHFYQGEKVGPEAEILNPAIRIAFRGQEPLNDSFPDNMATVADQNLLRISRLQYDPEGSGFIELTEIVYAFISELPARQKQQSPKATASKKKGGAK